MLSFELSMAVSVENAFAGAGYVAPAKAWKLELIVAFVAAFKPGNISLVYGSVATGGGVFAAEV